jgi:hypothetical protein
VCILNSITGQSTQKLQYVLMQPVYHREVVFNIYIVPYLHFFFVYVSGYFNIGGRGWLNELGRWIQLIQAYHQYAWVRARIIFNLHRIQLYIEK